MRAYASALLLACSALLALASPAPTHVLKMRQNNDGGFPVSIPPNCTSQCSVVQMIAQCNSSQSTTCLCNNTVGSDLLECINCGVNLGGVQLQQQLAAQSQLNSFVAQCDQAGATISPLTIGATGTAPTPSTSATPTGAAPKGRTIPGGMVGLLVGVVLSVLIVGL